MWVLLTSNSFYFPISSNILIRVVMANFESFFSPTWKPASALPSSRHGSCGSGRRGTSNVMVRFLCLFSLYTSSRERKATFFVLPFRFMLWINCLYLLLVWCFGSGYKLICPMIVTGYINFYLNQIQFFFSDLNTKSDMWFSILCCFQIFLRTGIKSLSSLLVGLFNYVWVKFPL